MHSEVGYVVLTLGEETSPRNEFRDSHEGFEHADHQSIEPSGGDTSLLHVISYYTIDGKKFQNYCVYSFHVSQNYISNVY